MNEEAIKDIVKREKLYKNNNADKKLIIGLILVAAVYVFFFTSNLTMTPPISSASGTSKIGEEYEFAEKRTVRIADARYSADQKMMEVVLNFTNENHDGINDYYYVIELLNGNSEKVKIEEVYNEELFTVLRFADLKQSYKELTLYFAPKTVEMKDVTDDMTGTIVLNKRNMSYGKIDTSRTREAYLEERLDGIAESYQTRLEKQEEKLEEYMSRKAALEDENDKLKENEKYMTEREVNENKYNIYENEMEIAELNDLIREQETKIERTKNEILDVENKQIEIE